MHYELYVDSLFFINFIMNLCLLTLVDQNTFRSAGFFRTVAGAAAGALFFFVPFIGFLPVLPKLIVGAAAAAGMIGITFPVRNFKMFLKLLEKLLIYSFGLGGTMLFVIRSFPAYREGLTSVFGILCMGVSGYLLFHRQKSAAGGGEVLCRAKLYRKDVQITVDALVDSGNSLIEPISGKAVCVVGQEAFAALWKGEEDGFRAIPYHSIGKKRGILPGYLLPKMVLEIEGVERKFENIYIAVSDEEISGEENAGGRSVKMIIHPGLLAKRG